SSRDELGHLRTQIDDQNLVVAGEPIGIGAAHEGRIEDGHPDLMCGAPRVRSRPLFPPAKPGMIRPLWSASRRPCNSAAKRGTSAFQLLVALAVIAAAFLDPFQTAVGIAGLVGVVLIEASVHTGLSRRLVRVFRGDR